jgi:FAD/FMN-containing dehydrogenase/Fe-S oxidoreductase
MGLLDPQRERIQDDLRGLVAGDVRCDDVFLQLFASDASIYEIKPLGVVRPRSAADVAACVQYAAGKNLSIHARGAGTNVAGESLGSGIIVDFSTHLRRVIRIDEDRVRVQAGIVHEQLNAQLHQQNRMFAPDPATSDVTTIGSMVAIDAAGSRWLRYGSTRRHVQSLQVVLADGQILEVGREPLVDGQSTSSIPAKRDLVNRLAKLLKENEAVIREHQPKTCASHGGYHLLDVLTDEYLDLAALLVGSEGTLALITEAQVGTVPLPAYRGVAMLMFDSVEKAANTVLDVLAIQPTACELMDRRHLSFAREVEPRFEQLIPNETEAVLLVEQEGDDPEVVREQLNRLTNEIWQHRRVAFGARQTYEPDETALFWRLVHQVQPALYRVRGPSQPVPIVEDMSVSPGVLPEFLVRMQNVLKRHQVTASLFCHAGHGQMHILPFLDLSNPEDVERMRQMAEELYQEVFALRGSVSGEHGCGLSRSSFIRQQAGPLFDVFREVKQIFDPRNILNPGKIVSDDPDLMTRHLARPVPFVPPPTPPSEATVEAVSEEMRNLTELQLDWHPNLVCDAVSNCNRCGECRVQTPGLRMCPLFRIGPDEESSPRAKVNLIRGVLTGAIDLTTLTTEEFKSIADLCIHCHACRIECPACVDVPRLMRESKGAYVVANGLTLADWAMTRLDLLGSLGSMAAPFTNWALDNRQMRWLLEKMLGISQGRKLPHVAARSFMRRAARRRLTRPSRRAGLKVLYFVDIYANYFDPQLGEALAAVLEHSGIAVFIPPDQKQAGMPSIACGKLEHARSLATHNVALLAEAVRQGYHIVATEPSAALCLTHEYPQLLNDDDARLVAANSSEACSFLWNLHTRGQLQLDLKPINLNVGYHMPCHLRALRVGSPGEHILGLIPGVRVRKVDAGCSGMAGTYGLQHKNYRNSLRAGRKLISKLRDPDLQAGATECSTCKLQMEQGVSKPTIHPIKLLALSYGLMPQIARGLQLHREE